MIPQIACRGKRMDQVWTSIRTANSGAQEGPAGVAGRSSGSSELGRLTVGDFFLSVGMEDLPPNNPFSQVRSGVRIERAVRAASSGVELDVQPPKLAGTDLGISLSLFVWRQRQRQHQQQVSFPAEGGLQHVSQPGALRTPRPASAAGAAGGAGVASSRGVPAACLPAGGGPKQRCIAARTVAPAHTRALLRCVACKTAMLGANQHRGLDDQ